MNKSDQISNAEQLFGFTFPEDYLSFMEENPNVSYKKFTRKFKNKEGLEYVIENFFSIEDVISFLEEYTKEDVPYLSDKTLIHIGNTIASPIICLGITEQSYGHIFILDDDFGLTFQNDSVNDFIYSLTDI